MIEHATLVTALRDRDLRRASEAIRASADVRIDFLMTTGNPLLLTIEVKAVGYAVISLNDEMRSPDRVAAIADLMSAYLENGTPVLGACVATINDGGIGARCVAPSDYRPDVFLVPDSLFILRKGYITERAVFGRQSTRWRDRAPIAFWRGSTAGHKGKGWKALPRIRLCKLSLAHPDVLDAAITHIVQMSDDERTEIETCLPVMPRIPESHFDRYRLHIDVDGNSSSWPGLFIKLLSGSPVLKLASEQGWRQWYYDRLIPWANFVPVESDMFDLIEKARWLLAHDGVAERIGAAGRALADTMTYEVEVRAAVSTIAAAIASTTRGTEVLH
jgi:hypothetical protein